jgi:hypothetical protein
VDWLESTGTGWLWMIGGVVLAIAAGYARRYLEAEFGIGQDFFIERKKAKALAEYQMILAFVNGQSDFHSYLIVQAAIALSVFIMATTNLIGAGFVFAVRTVSVEDTSVLTFMLNALIIGYVFFALVSIKLLLNLRTMAYRFDRFREYELGLNKQFKIDLHNSKPSDPVA